MSIKRVEQFNALNTGTLLHVNDGALVIDMPGDPTFTSHTRVQYDLGPVTATFASWCLDALLGEIKTSIEPNDVQKGQVLAMTRCIYPEKVIAAEVTEDRAPSKRA